MAAFFYRFAGKPEVTQPSSFQDVDPSNMFYKEISWMQVSGISTGWNDDTFRPYQPIDRGAIAAFIYRYKNGTK